ncbi:MAG TPA: OsmC family protein [Ktedonobacteraceae bacterium]|nr:OsmC family protein [Ktedonobacteraceae bacterium]
MVQELEMQARHVVSLQFEAKTEGGHTLTLDTHEHNVGATPMEMLLASLAGCSGISVISILQKKQQNVTLYEVCVRGKQAETHPQVFTEITVEHILSGHNISPIAVERAIELAETRYCTVSVMLSKVVQLKHSYRIIEA